MSEFINAVDEAIGISEILVNFRLSKDKTIKYLIGGILSGDVLRFKKEDKRINKLFKEGRIDKEELGILEYENAIIVLKNTIRFFNENVNEEELQQAIDNTDNALILLYISIIFKAHDVIPKIKEVGERIEEVKKKNLMI